MYTDDMRKAFHSIVPPKGFQVQIIDSDHFLVIKLNELDFVRMVHDEKIQALQYIVNVKKVLEIKGAIVLVTREAIK